MCCYSYMYVTQSRKLTFGCSQIYELSLNLHHTHTEKEKIEKKGYKSDSFWIRIHVVISIHVSKCFLYIFTVIPPLLTDPQQFHYCTDSNPGTGADDAFVLKRGVWRNATWPSHSRPAIAAGGRHFPIWFLP